MTWKFNKKIFVPPEDCYGFVYCIIDDKGKEYWGKKALTHRKKTRLGKRTVKKTGKRVKITQIDSGWKDYWGSSKPLQEYIAKKGNTNGFSRTIIKLCKNKASLSYWETYYLFEKQVLFRDTWNGHILSRFFRGKIHD